MGWLEAVLAIGGLVIPPAADFIKKKFIPAENDTPERTAGTLAVSNPEILPAYVSATSELLKARKDFFNRDVIGVPSLWVVDLRAAIRPVSVVGGFILLGMEMFTGYQLDDNTRAAIILNNASWFGSRI